MKADFAFSLIAANFIVLSKYRDLCELPHHGVCLILFVSLVVNATALIFFLLRKI